MVFKIIGMTSKSLHGGSATGGFTPHDFTIGRVAAALSAPQTTAKRTREVKEKRKITLMVYKSSLNTQ